MQHAQLRRRNPHINVLGGCCGTDHRHIEQIAKASAPARQLMQLPGVGATTATALVAMIGRGQEFKCGRQLSAWLGLVPGQYTRVRHFSSISRPQ